MYRRNELIKTKKMNNLDLNLKINRDKKILSNYDYETLLLEISTNIQNINETNVLNQALKQMKLKYEEALKILTRDLTKITNYAIIYRYESLIKPEFVLELHKMDCYYDFINEIESYAKINNLYFDNYIHTLNEIKDFKVFINRAFPVICTSKRKSDDWIELYKEFNLF